MKQDTKQEVLERIVGKNIDKINEILFGMHPLKAYALKHGIKLKKIAADLNITEQHLYLNVFRNKHLSAKLKARIEEYLKQKGA